VKIADGVSPGVGAGLVLTSLIVVTLLYAVLAAVELGLLLRYARTVPAAVEASDDESGAAEPAPAFLYSPNHPGHQLPEATRSRQPVRSG
jgi:cytochrome d ubiquinol oxidase subunit I